MRLLTCRVLRTYGSVVFSSLPAPSACEVTSASVRSRLAAAEFIDNVEPRLEGFGKVCKVVAQYDRVIAIARVSGRGKGKNRCKLFLDSRSCDLNCYDRHPRPGLTNEQAPRKTKKEGLADT